MEIRMIDEKLGLRLQSLVIECANDTKSIIGMDLVYDPERRFEPLTRQPFLGRKLFGGALGYASYCWSNLLQTTVGRYCSIAEHVSLMGRDHPTDWVTTHPLSYAPKYRTLMQSKDVQNWDAVSVFESRAPKLAIGHDVWIGRDAVLAREIQIGTGAIVAGGAVVTKDVPPYAIVGGIPAKIIRYRFDEALIQRLIESEWWNYRMSDFGDFKFNHVERFLDQLDSQKDRMAKLPDSQMTWGELVDGQDLEIDMAAWL